MSGDFDFNNFTDTGFYFVGNTNTSHNNPSIFGTGALLVLKTGGTSNNQILFVDGGIAIRSYYNGWGEWKILSLKP